MKSTFPLLSVAVVTACSVVVFAAGPPSDPIHAQLFPPELLMQHREEIGLTKKQVEQIRVHLDQAAANATDYQKNVGEATKKLAELLSVQEIDEAAAMKQLDEVLAAEENLKRLHLRLMIRIKNELTDQQRQLAAKISRDPRSEGLEKRLRSKLVRIEKEVQRRANSGQPPFDAVELMQSFQKEMQAGRHKEAEAVLDRVMKMLGLGKATKAKTSPDNQQGNHSKAPPAAGSRVSAAKSLSLEAVQEQVDALRVDKLAWREIPWKTCLLEALKEAREKNKPVLLWLVGPGEGLEGRC